MSNKSPLIVFSGGLDSTYMLYDAMTKGDVYACYFHSHQHPHKVEKELAARAKIIEEVSRLTGNKVINDIVVYFNLNDNVRSISLNYDTVCRDSCAREPIPDGTWAQAHLWIFGLLRVSDANIHSEIQMGYVGGDCISLHLDNMRHAWHYLQLFSKRNNVELHYPISTTTKETILKVIPRELVRLTWSCELPAQRYLEPDFHATYVPCENCIPCRDRKREAYMWEIDNFPNKFEEWFFGDPVEAPAAASDEGLILKETPIEMKGE